MYASFGTPHRFRYRLVFRYEYQVNGKEFHPDLVSYGMFGASSTEFHLEKQLRSAYYGPGRSEYVSTRARGILVDTRHILKQLLPSIGVFSVFASGLLIQQNFCEHQRRWDCREIMSLDVWRLAFPGPQRLTDGR